MVLENPNFWIFGFVADDNPNAHQETDDEGIERDSGDNDEDPSNSNQLGSFDLVIRVSFSCL